MKYKITLGGKIYEIEVEQGNATLLDEYEAKSPVAPAPVTTPVATAPSSAPTQAPAVSGGKTIVSPLPGTVVNLKKKAGDTIKKNEVVAIVEAMKMENEITASEDGKIASVLVTKGANIPQGAALYELQ